MSRLHVLDFRDLDTVRLNEEGNCQPGDAKRREVHLLNSEVGSTMKVGRRVYAVAVVDPRDQRLLSILS